MASNKTKATHPFYSLTIRSALQKLAARGASTRTSSSRFSSSHVDSDTSDDESKATIGSSNESDQSSDDEDVPVVDGENASPEQIAVQLTKSTTAKNTKKANSRAIKFANAPSITLPLPFADDDLQNKQQLALSIPTILLPNNYLRNNPNYDSSDVASHLLSTWDSLHHVANDKTPTILIVLLQSGRFASAAFALQTSHHYPNGRMTMLAHKTSTRYTVRKGQGGSQSAHDSKSKAKSMGAQLRREGERQLRLDVVHTWREWKQLGLVERSIGVWVGVPKAMRREYLFGGDDSGSASSLSSSALIDKHDDRIKSIPLDYGRPTLEAVEAVMECLMRCEVGDMTEEDQKKMFDDGETQQDSLQLDTTEHNAKSKRNEDVMNMKEVEKQLPDAPPYTPLHEAVVAGDLEKVKELLQIIDQSKSEETEGEFYDINTKAGPEYQTPLHLASSSTHDNAVAILNALLLQGRADVCAIDGRGRPAYYLASSDKIREAFRLARGKLGEDYCAWDAAKVGPALSSDDLEAKRIKALEKKKRQRERQKEKKKEEAEAAAKAKQEEEEKAAKLKAEEDAKRVRDGLKPKTGTGNTCDFCMKLVKKKSSMFQRLQYYYCSTDCVKRHQRELVAAAAQARLGK
jgi:hypothetical protein